MTTAEKLVKVLTEKKMTCATAESCTGGGVGYAITAVSGSSAVFWGGIISYDNSVKQRVLGVPEEVLATKGAVFASGGSRSRATVITEKKVFPGDRESVRAAAIEHALEMLLAVATTRSATVLKNGAMPISRPLKWYMGGKCAIIPPCRDM